MIRLLAFILAAVFSQSAQAQEEYTDSHRQIAELLITEDMESMEGMLVDITWQAMLPSLELGYPDATPEQFEEARSLIEGVVIDLIPVIQEQTVELYLEFFTEEELLELYAFYQSDLGRKFMDLMPEMTQRSMTMGQELAEPALMEVVPDLIQILSGTNKE